MDTLIPGDTTDLAKYYAKHLEGLGRVHDGSDPEAERPWLLGLQPSGASESADAYLQCIEQKLTASYPPAVGKGRPGPFHMGTPGALSWGLLSGDVLIQEFGGGWEFPEWTGRLDAKVFDFAVDIPILGQDPGVKPLPMQRVVQFVNIDREYTLVSLYQFLRDIRAGGVSSDHMTPGEWNVRGDYQFRIHEDETN